MIKLRREILLKLEREKIRQYEEYGAFREIGFRIGGIDCAIKIINEYDKESKQYFTVE